MSNTSQVASGIQDEIRSANANFEKLAAAGDAAGMSELYTSDGMVLPTGMGILTGKDAIKQFWQMALSMGVAAARLKTIEIDELGDTAVEMGNYELDAADGTTIDQGKYIVVWKKLGGQWLLHKDIWNTSVSKN